MYTIKSISDYNSVRVSYSVACLLVGSRQAHLLCGADSSECFLADLIDYFLCSPRCCLDVDYAFKSGKLSNLSNYEKEER